MKPIFQMRIQALNLLFDAQADFAARFSRKVDEDPGAPFRKRPGPGGQVILASKTGGTQLVVAPGEIRGQTRYFGDFMSVNAWAKRKAYTLDKLGYLMDALESLGARPLMTALTMVAYAPYPDEATREEHRKAAWKALHLGSIFAEWPPVDFVVRGGRKLGDHCFVATGISWYQRRAFSLMLPATQTGNAAPFALRDWEGTVDEEGLELRIDVNNKAGLGNGDLSWPASKTLKVFGDALDATPQEFSKVEAALAGTSVGS